MSRYSLFTALMLSVSMAFASDHILPHFTDKTGEWSTSLSLVNSNSTSVNIEIEAYSETGASLRVQQYRLEPFAQLNGPIASLFPSLAGQTGWFRIHTDKQLLDGLVVFTHLVTGGTSSLALGQSGRSLTLPLLENKGTTVSGFALTNTSPLPNRLRLFLRDLDSHQVSMAELELTGHAKLKGVLADIFANVPQRANLQIHAESPISGFALTFHNNFSQIVAVPGTFSDQGVLPDLRMVAHQALEEGNAVGLSASIAFDGQDPLVATAGLADLAAGELFQPQHSSDIGSITKTFIATLFLRYQEEGRLDLDDKLAQWLPSFPKADLISLRQLLNHTSGIADYLANPAALEEALASLGQSQQVSPQHLLDLALAIGDGGFDFEPGTSWNYSNTNYTLLGLVAEAEMAQPIAAQLRQRFFEPLGMHHTFFGGGEPAPGRSQNYLMQSGAFTETGTSMDYNWYGAAGAMLSTAEDLTLFARALFGGQLLSPASFAEMTTTVGLDGGLAYGLGLVVIDLPQGRLYGHTGGTLGGTAFLGWLAEDKTTLVNLINTATEGDESENLMSLTFMTAFGEANKRVGRSLPGQLRALIPN